ncbi:MAG: OmpA family protein [Cyclobacteriaceae bacterium]|nr:OmpA family protein [Cyclobacteriaceae bacterium]
MKYTTKILTLFVVLFLLNNTYNVHSATKGIDENETQPLSFVVVGAFVFHKNAERFVKYVKSLKLDAKYALNPYRSLYYVYVFQSPEKEKAVERVHQIWENYEFDDAWVYSGYLEGVNAPENSIVERPVNALITENKVYEKKERVEVRESQTEDEEVEEQFEKEEINETEEPEPTEEKEEPKEEVVEPEITQEFKVYINSLNSSKFNEVKGTVEIMDPIRSKRLIEVKTHELFGLNDPKNGKSQVKMVSRIFGYRPLELIVDLKNPDTDSLEQTYTHGDSLVIDFELDRLRRGDIAVMWNVLFFKDAAIMRPESKPELNSLLEMLKENPEMRVRLHGHTNGNSRGKIIMLEEGDKNFFSISSVHKESTGSSSKLSEERAYTIQQWLISEGISADRTEIKGWGGKRMLVEKHDNKAFQNVRVEVEVLN